MPKVLRYSFFALKLVVGVGIIYWLVRTDRLALRTYQSIFATNSLLFLFGVLGAQILALVFFVSRWWILLRIHGLAVPFGDVLRTGLQGAFTFLLLPGSVGLDGIRLLYIRRHFRARLMEGAASLLMDRCAGLAGLLLLGIVSASSFRLLEASDKLDPIIMVNGAILSILALGLLVLTIAPWSFMAQVRGFKRVARIVASLSVYRRHNLAMACAILLAIISHVWTAVAWWCGLKILSTHVSFVGLCGISSMLTFIFTLPLTPLGLGVTDGAAEIMFGWINIPHGAELQMLLRAAMMTISVACVVAFLRARGSVSISKNI